MAFGRKGTKHKLGLMAGTVWDDDGTISYFQTVASLGPDFVVRAEDVSAFSLVRRSSTAMTHELRILGRGTTLAVVAPISEREASKLEAFFRAHPKFATA